MTWRTNLTATLAAWALTAAAARAAEPWADRALPKAEGLILWLDAARQDEPGPDRPPAELLPRPGADEPPEALAVLEGVECPDALVLGRSSGS